MFYNLRTIVIRNTMKYNILRLNFYVAMHIIGKIM